jgi:hypothetical protein
MNALTPDSRFRDWSYATELNFDGAGLNDSRGRAVGKAALVQDRQPTPDHRSFHTSL